MCLKSLDPFGARPSLDAQIVPPLASGSPSLLPESLVVAVVFSASEIKVVQVHPVSFLPRPLIFCSVLS